MQIPLLNQLGTLVSTELSEMRYDGDDDPSSSLNLNSLNIFLSNHRPTTVLSHRETDRSFLGKKGVSLVLRMGILVRQ